MYPNISQGQLVAHITKCVATSSIRKCDVINGSISVLDKKCGSHQFDSRPAHWPVFSVMIRQPQVLSESHHPVSSHVTPETWRHAISVSPLIKIIFY